MKHWDIKASTKLPRGTYLYIRVGDRFYAGEEVVTQETRLTERETYENYWFSDKYKQSTAAYLNARGRRIPRYHIEDDKPEPRDPKQTVMGHEPKLTDEFKEVKQFRRLNQAEAACDRLKALYGGLGIKCVIELHKGDKQ